MQRKLLDRMISFVGLTLATVLIVAGSLLTWASSFVTNEVHSQLAAQQIFFPPKGDPSIAGPEYAKVRQYAGQQLTTGDQAKVYADNFIGNHLKATGGGKTYAQLSTEARANPTDTKLAGTVNTMFKGETLRGLLLNAYAFGKMGMLAGIGAIVSFIGGGVLILLSIMGLMHGRRAPEEQTVFTSHSERKAATVA
jgi:hypothetical protein